MSVNHLNPEYPEHLNPFRKRANTLARSFRGIRNAIVKSITGKEKDKPTIRPKPALEYTQRNVLSLPPTLPESEVVFPRSRFSERINKTDTILAQKSASLTAKIHNPFEADHVNALKADSIKDDDIGETPPRPAERTKRKRRKKFAPAPPGSVSGDSVNGSKWSLVSTESDLSSSAYSETEIEYIDAKNTEENEEILKITREIAKFAEDTNNNTIQTDSQSDLNRDNAGNTSKEENQKTSNEDIADIGLENKINEPNDETDHTKDQSVVESTDLRKNDITAENPELNVKLHSSNESNPIVMEDETNEVLTRGLVDNEHRLSVKGTIEFFECTTNPSLTPKIRKNILTKEKLLGSDEIEH